MLTSASALLLVNQAPATPLIKQNGAAPQALQLLPPIASDTKLNKEREPDGNFYELTLRWPADGRLAGLLADAGIERKQANDAETLVKSHFDGDVPPDSDIKLAISLDARSSKEIIRLSVLSDMGDFRLESIGGRLRVATGSGRLQRHVIPLGDKGYWAMRRLGLSGSSAEAVMRKAASSADSGELAILVARRQDRFGKGASVRVLYAALNSDRRKTEWLLAPEGQNLISAADIEALHTSRAFMRPVKGPVTSEFGPRRHPILGFVRLHRGIDFAAAWGTPVRAVADGQIAAAEWRGGYGRQVRIDHGSASLTTYSHLADMTVQPGQQVRKGQLIGFVGASGLATGPHLHFEVYRHGRAVDPSGSRPLSDQAQTDGRLRALLERYRKATAV